MTSKKKQKLVFDFKENKNKQLNELKEYKQTNELN
jgi:hypothetical protein